MGLSWVQSQNPKTSGRLPDPDGHTREGRVDCAGRDASGMGSGAAHGMLV